MWIRGGGGKTLIHKMWIKNMFFFLNPSLSQLVSHQLANCVENHSFQSVISKVTSSYMVGR